MESTPYAPAHFVDQFGFTFSERLKQYTVAGWTPARCYTIQRGRPDKRGRAKAWGVISPDGFIQDCVRTKAEAVRYCADRNARAAWAYNGGVGPVPGSDYRFRDPASPRRRVKVNRWESIRRYHVPGVVLEVSRADRAVTAHPTRQPVARAEAARQIIAARRGVAA